MTEQVQPPDTFVRVALTRMEGKLDLIGERVTNVIARLDDHETRLRGLEQHPSQNMTPDQLQSLDARVDTLEGDSVTKRAVWAALGLIIAAMGALASLLVALH